MKVLIAVDDSVFSQAAVKAVAKRCYDTETEVRLVSAVEPLMSAEYDGRSQTNVYEVARKAIDYAVDILRSSKNPFEITTEIVQGSPKQVILDEAENWGADLIVVGSHGRRGIQRFLLGSVSQAVALHAKCSVEIVRVPQAKDVEL
ncbi:MAG TPA: universal stress protein [Blastocatellia bacterium]|nr:universal stress protein [Blastocatellia bacterium]